jgi:hypothetical protein
MGGFGIPVLKGLPVYNLLSPPAVTRVPSWLREVPDEYLYEHDPMALLAYTRLAGLPLPSELELATERVERRFRVRTGVTP